MPYVIVSILFIHDGKDSLQNYPWKKYLLNLNFNWQLLINLNFNQNANNLCRLKDFEEMPMDFMFILL